MLKNSLLLPLTGVGVLAALAKPATACEQIYAGYSTSGVVTPSSLPFHGFNTGNGIYRIEVPSSTFGCGFPVMTFEPFGFASGVSVGVLDSENCAGGLCEFEVHFYNPSTLQPVNNGWVFTVVSTSNP
jgi:hypothetical protein